MEGQTARKIKSVSVKQLIYMTRDRVVFEAIDGEYYEIPKEGRTDIEMFELLWGPNWRGWGVAGFGGTIFVCLDCISELPVPVPICLLDRQQVTRAPSR